MIALFDQTLKASKKIDYIEDSNGTKQDLSAACKKHNELYNKIIEADLTCEYGVYLKLQGIKRKCEENGYNYYKSFHNINDAKLYVKKFRDKGYDVYLYEHQTSIFGVYEYYVFCKI